MRIAAQAAGKPRSRIPRWAGFLCEPPFGLSIEMALRQSQKSTIIALARVRKRCTASKGNRGGGFHHHRMWRERTAGRGSWRAGPASSRCEARRTAPSEQRDLTVFCHIPSSACRLPFVVCRLPPAFPFCDAWSPPHSTDRYVQPSSEPCLLNHQTARNVARLFLTDPCKSHGVWLARRCTPVTPLGPCGKQSQKVAGSRRAGRPLSPGMHGCWWCSMAYDPARPWVTCCWGTETVAKR
ncbi:hypothetical protein F5144DRAFT_21158 [Chaetomium tenue]|uniref:Uncharacterized protein n=1 Tax=Chaetomium tenue TaxID=1854479 RepID=A0ACB7PKW9_9PEZI|nr:hypothetical protein F5144DRAFT_21158 [Chaetomium globosum]